MSQQKPQDIDSYKKWLKVERGYEVSDKTETYYNSVTNKIRNDLKNSDFFRLLRERLREISEEYYLQTGYDLFFLRIDEFEFEVKSFESFLLKTYRKNIIYNRKWPGAPSNDWLTPENWFTSINDILRTLLAVKYLDGVAFTAEKLKAFCEAQGMVCKTVYEAREEGYYAAHVYTNTEFQIPKEDWDTKAVNVTLEIQITTQLQEVIRRLLHKYYEERREKARPTEAKWQWNYETDEFIANYLGHILHYVEGMIMEIRDKQQEKPK